jgi:outer membrane protein insertion porin family
MIARGLCPGTRLFLFLCALGMVLPAAAPAWAQANRVLSVTVEGNQRISTDAILQVVATKPGEEFSQEQLDRDVREIHNMGWFRAQPTSRVENTPDGVKVTFIVSEWPVIQSIQITGNKVIPTGQILAVMQTKPGNILNTPLLEKDIEAIEKMYTDKGYVGRVAGDSVGVDFEKTGILKIPIVEATVEKINITGNKKTKTYVIRRELSMKPGAPFSATALQRDYTRLDRLGIFDSIDEHTDPGSELGKVDVNWGVKERRTGQVSLGLGYSAKEKLVGRAELSETNFRGRGEGVNFLWETGGFSGRNSFQLGFFKPWLDQHRTSMSINVYDKLVYRFANSLGTTVTPTPGPTPGVTATGTNTYDERHKGGTLTFARPLSEPFTLSLTGRFDDVSTSTVTNTPNTFPVQDGYVSTGTVRGTLDTRDFANNPTGGALHTAWIEAGVSHLRSSSITTQTLGTSGIAKLGADLRRYLPLKAHKGKTQVERSREKIPVLALRFMAGTSTGELPFYEQFFVGGADSLRGYLEDRYWGSYMFLTSVEYRRPLASALTGVLFTDWGDAWGAPASYNLQDPTLQTRFRQHSNISPHGSVGLGLRVTTPVGPIRLDYGYGSEGGRLHFSIGHSF